MRPYNVKITAVRKVQHSDLSELYDNPIEHACDVREGDSWISVGGKKPEGLCDSAWESMRWFVEELAAGQGVAVRSRPFSHHFAILAIFAIKITSSLFTLSVVPQQPPPVSRRASSCTGKTPWSSWRGRW